MKNILYPYYRLIIQYKYIRNLKSILRIGLNDDLRSLETYIFNSLDLGSDFQSGVEFIIAQYLVKKGSKVIVLYDDILEHIDRETIQTKYSFSAKNRARRFINRCVVYQNSNLAFVPYSELVDDIDVLIKTANDIYITKDYMYQNIDITEYVESSLIRYIHNGTKDLLDKRKKNFILSSIFNAVVSITIAREAHRKYQPTNVVSVHTVYSSWGPFMKYFKNSGHNPVQWSKGQAFNNSIFVTKWKHRQNSDMFYSWRQRNDRQLTQDERNLLASFLRSRFDRSSGFTKHIKGSKLDTLEDIIDTFEKNSTYAIFPNILWDNALTDADTIFSNVIEWIRYTLHQLMRINANIIVRAHPAESSFMKPTIGVIDIIKAEVPEIVNYEKVVFVKPESTVSSYWLLDRIKAGIVYNGTLGLEMAYRGTPVIFGGAPPYSDYCGLKFPQSIEEYLGYIEDPSAVMKANNLQREQLLSFMFMYFFEFEIRVPFLSETEWAQIDFITAKKVLLDGDEALDRICSFIEADC